MINATIFLGLEYLIIFLLIIKGNFKELNYWIKQQRIGIIWKRKQTYLAGELTSGKFHLEFLWQLDTCDWRSQFSMIYMRHVSISVFNNISEHSSLIFGCDRLRKYVKECYTGLNSLPEWPIFDVLLKNNVKRDQIASVL